MHKYAQDLSTIWGLGILTAVLVAAWLGVISDKTAGAVATGASMMIVIPQRRAVTTVQAENAVVAATVVRSDAAPVVQTR